MKKKTSSAITIIIQSNFNQENVLEITYVKFCNFFKWPIKRNIE